MTRPVTQACVRGNVRCKALHLSYFLSSPGQSVTKAAASVRPRLIQRWTQIIGSPFACSCESSSAENSNCGAVFGTVAFESAALFDIAMGHCYVRFLVNAFN
jgi:hypothetical protein